MKRLLALGFFMFAALSVSVCVAQDKEMENKKACEKLRESFDTPSAFKIGEDDKVKASVPKKEVVRGIRGKGDPRDVIPPIYDPKFESIEDATPHYQDDDRVLVYTVDETTRAYPHKVLNRHEIVNDKIGKTAFMVIY